MLAGCIIASLGVGLELSTNFPIHLTGAVIYAIGQGLMSPTTYRYAEEYVP